MESRKKIADQRFLLFGQTNDRSSMNFFIQLQNNNIQGCIMLFLEFLKKVEFFYFLKLGKN